MGKMNGLVAQASATIPPESAQTDATPPDQPSVVAQQMLPLDAPAGAAVVEAAPLVRAVERLHQGVRTDLQGVLAAAREQETYLREWKQAYNAMTTEWYKIADELPQARAALDDLKREIAQRRAELAETRAQAGEETAAFIVEQGREMARTIRQVRTAALLAVGLIAVACLVGLTGLVILAATVLLTPEDLIGVLHKAGSQTYQAPR